MTAAVVMTVTLETADGHLKAAARYDITHPTPWDNTADGPSATRRRYAAQRRNGDQVRINLYRDSQPAGSWNADHRWPRETADAIRNAREGTTP